MTVEVDEVEEVDESLCWAPSIVDMALNIQLQSAS
jgi:hypothetical protein